MLLLELLGRRGHLKVKAQLELHVLVTMSQELESAALLVGVNHFPAGHAHQKTFNDTTALH